MHAFHWGLLTRRGVKGRAHHRQVQSQCQVCPGSGCLRDVGSLILWDSSNYWMTHVWELPPWRRRRAPLRYYLPHNEPTKCLPSLPMQRLRVQAPSRSSPHPPPLCVCTSAPAGTWRELAQKWSHHSHV